MSPEREHAEVLLGIARDDQLAVAVLAADERSGDAIIGFHAQQAVEKALKSVLALHGADYPRTHDLGLLLEHLDAADVDVPPAVRAADALTPWAVAFRYGQLLDESVDRAEIAAVVQAVIDWAAALVADG